MKPRAVIFDIYKTILELGPPPADAAERWEFLWEDKLADPARLTLEEFAVECERIVAREHKAARAAGVPFPEVFWPAVAKEALPELARLSEVERDEFLFQHARLRHTASLMPGAAEVLSALAERNIPLGLASNCQPYTLRELDIALAPVKSGRAIFQPDLCFFSFVAGFSKPDPHVFRILRARLQALGISPGETLMVGDRPDNDIESARAQGYQTWLLAKDPPADGSRGGNWLRMQQFLSPGVVETGSKNL